MAAVSSKIPENSTRSHGTTFQKIWMATFDVSNIYHIIRQFGTEQYFRGKNPGGKKKVLTVKENKRFDLFVLQMEKGSM